MPVESGQVWQLGRHRLMCGDATSKEDIDTLMDGKKATLCFADPPYGMKKENDGVLNDNLNYDDLLEFNKQWIPLSLDALTDIGSWYCWGQDEPLMDIYAFILRPMKKTKPLTFRNLITWFKAEQPSGANGNGIGSSIGRMYAPLSEKCLFVMLGSQGTTPNSDEFWTAWEPMRAYLDGEREKMGWTRKDANIAVGSTVKGGGMASHWFSTSQFSLPTKEQYKKLNKAAAGKAFTMPYEELKAMYTQRSRAYFNNTHDNMNDVWHFNRAKDDERFHPTTKPFEVCARAIKSSSREGDIVLDPFAGGGSTLIACERLNRTCYTMELSPDWCQVIIDRWEAETGKKASLVS